jgi:hypothetical protein
MNYGAFKSTHGPNKSHKNFVFILVIQLMVKYHNIFHLIFQELCVHVKMCMDYHT